MAISLPSTSTPTRTPAVKKMPKFRLPRRTLAVKKIKALKYKQGGYELLTPPPVESPENVGRISSGQPSKKFSKVDSGKIDDTLARFGPVYGTDQQSVSGTKKKAWHHVKKRSSKEDPGLIKEIYVAAIRRVETQAREMYDDDLISGTKYQFRSMMIKDGCFFLQLAFLILGKSLELGYSEVDPIFGRKQHRRDIMKWIESMFFVGNQIPMAVLKELMKQEFFQDVIKRGNWDSPPSSLGKKVLYELLVLPELKRSPLVSRRKGNNLVDNNESRDLLSGLRSMVVGPLPQQEEDLIEPEVEDEFVDVEANEEDNAAINQETTSFPGEAEHSTAGDHLRTFLGTIGLRNTAEDHRSIFPSVTELKNSAIRIKKLKFGGTRSIRFDDYYFKGFLYLPVLLVEPETEILFRNLKAYEINEGTKPEVCSYLKFMSDIIQTPQDVKLLLKEGIIEGDTDDIDKLPEILGRLSSDNIRLPLETRNLKRKIREFSSPLIRFQGIINFVVFLTFLQAFFAVLAYFKPPKP